MELAFLCRLRKTEVLHLKESDIKATGLQITRVKGSKGNLTLYNDRLNAAITLSRTLSHTEARSINPTLVRGVSGIPLTDDGFDSAWDRLMDKAAAAGLSDFKFHQLKAKGVSDTNGDKQAASGHKTASMVALYDRKQAEVKPAGEK